jgi:hypothetical protein
MRNRIFSTLVALLFIPSSANCASAAVSEADTKYAQAAGQATQNFSTAIGNWGDTYQAAPTKVNSTEYKNWMKKAVAADGVVLGALKDFSRVKVSPGYKKSDITLRKFIKAYTSAIYQYAPAIKKNDRKLVRKANDALVAATSLFTAWGNDFARDTSLLTN